MRHQFRFSLFQDVYRTLTTGKKSLAIRCQAEPSCRTLKQLQPETILKATDTFPNSRFSQSQFFCGSGETSLLSRGDKSSDTAKMICSSHNFPSDVSVLRGMPDCQIAARCFRQGQVQFPCISWNTLSGLGGYRDCCPALSHKITQNSAHIVESMSTEWRMKPGLSWIKKQSY